MTRSQAGDGDPCPGDTELPMPKRHGRMFFLSSKRQFCAHQSHDVTKTPSLFEYDGRTPVIRRK